MGNYSSCTIVGVPAGCHPRTAKVLLPGGEVRYVHGPANAAEFMLEVPGHFVVNSRSMEVGRRFAPLAADEDLEMGNMYVMVPIKRVKAVIIAADMDIMHLTTGKEPTSGGKAKILPDTSKPKPKVEVQEKEEGNAAAMALEMGELKYRMSCSRSRRPNLETIAEEGFYRK